jgi:hypothetical protein
MNALKDYINQASLIIEGMKKYYNKFTDFGVDKEFYSNFESIINELKKLNTEQETLKVKFRSKTAQVDEKIDELNKFINQAEKAIKDEFSPGNWEEFGIAPK